MARLRDDPARAAILTDVDGTLAPIVPRPEEAAVPTRASELLARLSERYGMVGCVSGRRAEEARRLVGVEGIAYAGNHGLELLLPGEDAPRLDPALRGREGDAAGFLAASPVDLAAAGLRREDKGPIQALHWRGAEDEKAAEAQAREIAATAGRAGLELRWGRKVLELRPPGGGGKDAAVAALLTNHPGGWSRFDPDSEPKLDHPARSRFDPDSEPKLDHPARSRFEPDSGPKLDHPARSRFEPDSGPKLDRAVYAGDDRTDLDAFRRLRELEQEGELESAVCVGVASEEGPAEIAVEADLTVDGPAGWLALLESLAE